MKRIYLFLGLLITLLIGSQKAMALESEGLLEFPLRWTAETWQEIWAKGGLAWNVNTDEGAWVLQGKKTNWRGSVFTTAPVALPVNEPLQITFAYKCSCEVNLTISVCAEENDEEIIVWQEVKVLPASPMTYVRTAIPLTVTRPGVIRFTASPNIGVMAAGNIYLKDIEADYPSPDVAVLSLLSPRPDKIAANSDFPIVATFSNPATMDARNLAFAYSIDGNEPVREYFDRPMAPEELLKYSFKTRASLSDEGSHELKVWCEVLGDMQASNDTISATIHAVQPLEYPINDEFTDGIANWSVINSEDDVYKWGKGVVNETDGVAMFPTGAGRINDELWLYPVEIPAGKSRISFYYSSILGFGAASLKIMWGNEPYIDNMEELIVLENISNRGWINAFSQLELPADELRYFAILATGSSDGIILDHFKLDTGEDLCMESVVFDTTSGFNKSESLVTLSLINHGLTPQNDISVGYSINGLENQVRETIAGPINPGETYTHQFSIPADISEKDSYTLYGQILTVVGEDTQNDLIEGQTLWHWPNKATPYVQTFHNDLAQWTLLTHPESESKWGFTAWGSNAYYGTNVLSHLYSAGKVDNWAISECIEMEPGTYDVSFFYRTQLNYETEAARQSFELMYGDDATPEAMKNSIVRLEEFTVARPAYCKSITRITVDEAGKYYFGFHNFSPSDGGCTFIDGFLITPVNEGYSLPYSSDFDTKADEWTLYNPGPKFTSWNMDNTDGAKIIVTDHDRYTSENKLPEGLFASPRLNIEAGKEVIISIDYACVTEHNDVTLDVYGSTVDDPDQYEILASLPPTEEFKNHEIVLEPFSNSTEYFIGFRSNQSLEAKDNMNQENQRIYTLKVKSLEIKYNDTDSISNPETNSDITINHNGNDLMVSTPGGKSIISIYDFTGNLIKRIEGTGSEYQISCEETDGLLFISVENEGNIKTKKILK